MKCKNYIEEYYDESTRKSNRRIELLTKLFEHIVETKNFNDNMSQICKAIAVERKTMYRYYSNREAIIIDLYCLVEISREKELNNKIKNIMILEELSPVEKFYVILEINVELILKSQYDLTFLNYAKKIIHQSNQNTEMYLRYKKVQNDKKYNHYLPILVELEQKELLNSSILPLEYAKVIYNSLTGFVVQMMEQEDADIKPVDYFINLLKLSVISDNN